MGPRTNSEGIRQLKEILGSKINLQIVKLPDPNHPDDVLHLMSIISPLDKILAVIYKPLMPESFLNWLTKLGIKFVEVSETEYPLMACNILATAPRSIIMLENLPLIKKAKQIENFSKRLAFLLNGEDKENLFYKEYFSSLFEYSANRIPEIADQFIFIDPLNQFWVIAT